MQKTAWFGLLMFWAALAQAGDTAPGISQIQWISWSDDIFVKAQQENRLVILDLEAVWCHWCHVMEEKTYHDPKVVQLIRDKFIAVKVDQDSRPDLSNRYEDYGWPATILFSPKGVELAKRSGYLPPEEMAGILQAFIDDPTPGPSAAKNAPLRVSESAFLSADQKKELKASYLDQYDKKAGGWGFGHKYLQTESVQWAIHEAGKGDKLSETRARETLRQLRKLVDPVWGGMYQYSTDGVWTEPHFEKIMQVQADGLRLSALAYGMWHDAGDLKTADQIKGYLENFLGSPDGAFYTSQDADSEPGKHGGEYFKLDDKARRAKGIPRVDQHTYARETAWAAEALTICGMMTLDRKALDAAKKAMEWAIANRAISGGGFRHDSDDGGRLYLGDTLAVGQTALRLYGATADRKWLETARGAAKFITDNFRYHDEKGKEGGFVTVQAKGAAFPAMPQRDENVAAARFFSLLYEYTGDTVTQDNAKSAMRYLATPAIAERLPAAGVLLADADLSESPLHLTIIGKKSDPVAKALFEAGMKYPVEYKRLEWWDEAEGLLPRTDVKYPQMGKAAAFICSSSRCSLPIFKADAVATQIKRVLASVK